MLCTKNTRNTLKYHLITASWTTAHCQNYRLDAPNRT